MPPEFNPQQLRETAETIKNRESAETDGTEIKVAGSLDKIAQAIENAKISNSQANALQREVGAALVLMAGDVGDSRFENQARLFDIKLNDFVTAEGIDLGLIETPVEVVSEKSDDSIESEHDDFSSETTDEGPQAEESKEGVIDGARATLYEKLGADKEGGKWERFKAGLVDGIMDAGEMVEKLIKDPVGTIKEMVSGLWEAVKSPIQTIKAIGQSIWEAMSNIYETGKMAAEVVIGLLGGAGAMIGRKVVKTVIRNAKTPNATPKKASTPEPEIRESSVPKVKRRADTPAPDSKPSGIKDRILNRTLTPKVGESIGNYPFANGKSAGKITNIDGDIISIESLPSPSGKVHVVQINKKDLLPNPAYKSGLAGVPQFILNQAAIASRAGGAAARRIAENMPNIARPAAPVIKFPRRANRKPDSSPRRANDTPNVLDLNLSKLGKANSWEDLGKTLKALDESGVKVDGKYPAIKVYEQIKLVRTGKADINTITRAHGLRDNVAKLLDEQPSSPAGRKEAARAGARASVERVIRKNDVVAIGDIHGNYDIMIANLRSADLVDNKGNWKGGDRELVFHGDILGDRGASSLKAMEHIAKLKKQARAAGGDVQVLAGNHDDFAIAFLTGRNVAGDIPFKNIDMNGQAAGAYEFMRYIGRGEITNAQQLLTSGVDVKQVLTKMRNTPKGRAMLENICDMKICHKVDDTLFLHTDLTSNMADMLLRNNPGDINKTYQSGLRSLLLGEGPMPSGFEVINNTFLHTGNRDYLSPRQAAALKARLGINRVLHGHTDRGGAAQNIGGLEISSVDVSAGKGGKHMDRRSIGVIGQQNGALSVGAQAVGRRAA